MCPNYINYLFHKYIFKLKKNINMNLVEISSYLLLKNIAVLIMHVNHIDSWYWLLIFVIKEDMKQRFSCYFIILKYIILN